MDTISIIKFVLWIIFILIMFFFLSGGTISFSPFKISMPNWLETLFLLGAIFLFGGYITIKEVKARGEGFEKGVEYTTDYIVDTFGKKEETISETSENTSLKDI